eukprot:SAG25_NODE_1_length_41698_cov_149.842015_16_plen_82_part_00
MYGASYGRRPRLVAESSRLGHEPWAAAPHLATARGAMHRIWPRAWRVEKSIEFEPKRPPQPSYEVISARKTHLRFTYKGID